MKAISPSLAGHISNETTTLATLWHIRRTDGQVFGFTDASNDIEFGGVTYLASSGHTPSSVATNAEMSVDNLDVVSVLDDERITEKDIAAGRWDFAEVELRLVNYADLSMGYLPLRVGTLGRLSVQRGKFVAEVRGLTQALQQNMVDKYMPGCGVDLGSAKCGINLLNYTLPGKVLSVTDNRVMTVLLDLTGHPLIGPWGIPGYFTHGLMVFSSGENDGLSMEIKNYILGFIDIHLPMPNEIKVDDTFYITAGCDKSRATCLAKFDNVVNFRGFPDMPGNDKVMRYVQR